MWSGANEKDSAVTRVLSCRLYNTVVIREVIGLTLASDAG